MFFLLLKLKDECVYGHIRRGSDMSGEDVFKNPGVNWRTRTCLIVIGPITAHNIMVKREQQRQNIKRTGEKIKAPLQQRERLQKRRQARRCESSIKVQLLQEFLLFLFHLFVLFGNSFMYMIFGLSLPLCNVFIGYNVPLSVYSGAGPLCAAWGQLSSPAGSPKQWLQPPKSSPWATVIRLYLLRPNGKHIHTQMKGGGGVMLNLRSRNSRRVSKCL